MFNFKDKLNNITRNVTLSAMKVLEDEEIHFEKEAAKPVKKKKSTKNIKF